MTPEEIRNESFPQYHVQSRADRDAELVAFDQMSRESAQNRTLTASEGEKAPVATPDATDVSEVLVQQIAEAMRRHVLRPSDGRRKADDPEMFEFPCSCGEVLRNGGDAFDEHRARAVLPLVEAQVAPLRDEVVQWKLAAKGARREFVETEEALGRAVDRAEAAESALRQVRELADDPTPCACGDNEMSVRVADLLAILDSARVGAADTQPEGAGCGIVHPSGRLACTLLVHHESDHQWVGEGAALQWPRGESPEGRVIDDLACVSGATLRRALTALNLPVSGTKKAQARRLADAGQDAASVKAQWGWKAQRGGLITPGGITPGGMQVCPDCGRWGSNPAGLCVNNFHDATPPIPTAGDWKCPCGGRVVPETNRGIEHHICTECNACDRCDDPEVIPMAGGKVDTAPEADCGYWLASKPSHGWTCDCNDESGHVEQREWVPCTESHSPGHHPMTDSEATS